MKYIEKAKKTDILFRDTCLLCHASAKQPFLFYHASAKQPFPFFFNPSAPLLCCVAVYSVNAILIHQYIALHGLWRQFAAGDKKGGAVFLFTDCVITFKTINDLALKFSFQPCNPGGHQGLH